MCEWETARGGSVPVRGVGAMKRRRADGKEGMPLPGIHISTIVLR